MIQFFFEFQLVCVHIGFLFVPSNIGVSALTPLIASSTDNQLDNHSDQFCSSGKRKWRNTEFSGQLKVGDFSTWCTSLLVMGEGLLVTGFIFETFYHGLELNLDVENSKMLLTLGPVKKREKSSLYLLTSQKSNFQPSTTKSDTQAI